jgi:hypothetical protein
LSDVVLPAIVVLELLPSVEDPELPSDEFAGGPPIAVVPVDGVVLPALPAVVGPARALDVLLPGVVPVLFVPATLPVLGAVVEPVTPGVVLPIVLEPSACWLVSLPHGAPSGAAGVVVCASATPAPIASATAPKQCVKAVMADLLRSWKPVGGACAVCVH